MTPQRRQQLEPLIRKIAGPVLDAIDRDQLSGAEARNLLFVLGEAFYHESRVSSENEFLKRRQFAKFDPTVLPALPSLQMPSSKFQRGSKS